MRVALGAVAFTVLVLFYLGVYRPTRSSFSAWWSLSLLVAGLAITLLLFNDTPARIATYPVATALAAAGSTCVWFAMRSLRGRRLPRWLLIVGPMLILILASLATPDENGRATTGPVSLYMAVMFVAGAVEAWNAWQARRASKDGHPNGEALVALLVIALAATALGTFYAFRFLILMTVGSDSGTFERTAGSGPEDVTLLVCMVAVTFSVSAVGWDQQKRALRRLAMKDDLTGLWGRSEFRAQATRARAGAGSRGDRALLVVADLDHFKDINDTHGHAAGDGVLVAFAAVLTSHLRPGEPAGRLGGEEFGMVLLDGDDADALVRLRAISDDFAERTRGLDLPVSTVSYGFAGLHDSDAVDQVFEQADQAMYVAKAQGRDRAVRYTEEIGRRPSNLLRRRQSDWEDVEEPL